MPSLPPKTFLDSHALHKGRTRALTCSSPLLQADALPQPLNLLPCLSQVLLHQPQLALRHSKLALQVLAVSLQQQPHLHIKGPKMVRGCLPTHVHLLLEACTPV